MNVLIQQMETVHIPDVVALQRQCFPEPFPEELLWTAEHLAQHIRVFPRGQLVATMGAQVVASASATRISESTWAAHLNWEDTVGGPMLETYHPTGSTIYGLDISVHPGYRSKGIGRMLYGARFEMVQDLSAARYGTACRLPDYQRYTELEPSVTAKGYAQLVVDGQTKDRTLTPLLSYGLTYLGVISDYMDDFESGDSAALLEWKP